ncbi:molybdenum hydroxylase, partial [Chloroflexota bacterium]
MESLLVIRGAGDLASGIALRIFRAGFRFLMTEIEQPLTVRKTVSFSEAIFKGSTIVEGVEAIKVSNTDEIDRIIKGKIPIIVDEDLKFIKRHLTNPSVIIDARMEKGVINRRNISSPFLIGIGPGFEVGKNCNVVIETNRG